MAWLQRLVRGQGPAQRAARKLASALKQRSRWLLDSSQRAWLANKREVDTKFDSEYAVDTGGVVGLSSLAIDSGHRTHGVDYIASDPEELKRALTALRIDHDEFSFVDLGSGKGRALLLASAWPFRNIVGVEFAPELHRIAQQNVANYMHAEQRCTRFELHCMDATEYELPAGPLVIFLYNPFGPAVMRMVAQRVLASHMQQPREILVLYTNPFEERVWTDLGFHPVERGGIYVVLRPPGAGAR